MLLTIYMYVYKCDYLLRYQLEDYEGKMLQEAEAIRHKMPSFTLPIYSSWGRGLNGVRIVVLAFLCFATCLSRQTTILIWPASGMVQCRYEMFVWPSSFLFTLSQSHYFLNAMWKDLCTAICLLFLTGLRSNSGLCIDDVRLVYIWLILVNLLHFKFWNLLWNLVISLEVFLCLMASAPLATKVL